MERLLFQLPLEERPRRSCRLRHQPCPLSLRQARTVVRRAARPDHLEQPEIQANMENPESQVRLESLECPEKHLNLAAERHHHAHSVQQDLPDQQDLPVTTVIKDHLELPEAHPKPTPVHLVRRVHLAQQEKTAHPEKQDCLVQMPQQAKS
jgi:hypothetical protein